ncbi:hypothetical protein KHA96_21745 [Bacillus sp. FJAT-49711]|uniref:hypothetical protein n=1 Tax=Bacillus sp. FJAT-49711 TaxID=2833585 RepID=UPI001BC95ED0|nr:hypothetical protein [Bacillus sp. FJAT-49711]MBS4220921.1 hypothetical protein [Bacillus sp. FJAT-49711]
MKKYLIIACILFLTGCNQLIHSNVIIDWVDFLQFDGNEYIGSQLEISDPDLIGEKIGEIKHTLDGNIKNPNYTSKDGDAAYLPAGTDLYEIKDDSNLIAVKDKDSINGYKIYAKKDNRNNFSSINNDDVAKIQIFDEVSYNQFIFRKAITEKTDISHLIDIFHSGIPDSTVAFDYSDPKMSSFIILVYTSAPIAEKIPFFFDGEKYFWYNHESEVLSNEIEDILGISE